MQDGRRGEKNSACDSAHPTGGAHFAFPRRARLTASKEYDRVLKEAEVRKRAGPVRLTALGNELCIARLGLIVGKRGIAKANQRNRVKRVIREFFRQRYHELPAMDIVIQVLHPVSPKELRELLNRLFRELGLGERG